jgi:hypothetical protein
MSICKYENQWISFDENVQPKENTWIELLCFNESLIVNFYFEKAFSPFCYCEGKYWRPLKERKHDYELNMENESKDDEGWVTLSKQVKLPKTGEPIEIMFSDGKIKKSELFVSSYNDIIFLHTSSERPIIKWRYPKELKPDFEKLKNGDFLIVSYEDPEDKDFPVIMRCGYYFCLFDYKFVLNPDLPQIKNLQVRVYEFNKVKKITRIDIEKQTCEEI